MASVRYSNGLALAAAVLLLSFVSAVPSLSYNLHEGIARSVVYHREAAPGIASQDAECQSTSVEGTKSEVDVDLVMPLGEAVSAQLVHMDHHPDSPFHNTQLSFAEKIKNGLRRSKHRVSLIHRILSPDFSTERGIEFDPSALKAATTTFEEPLAASPGSYIMTISLGTPPQTKTAIADTGSDLNWVQCAPCTSCYSQNDPFYAPTKSSTYGKMAYSNSFCSDLPQKSNSGGFCTYLYGYGDQSTTQGDFSFETITLTTTSGSKVTVPKFAFGCGHKNQGTFSGTDGLVGLGQGPISFPSQLGSLFGNEFSYCLVSISSAATTTSPIVFGDSSDAISSSVNFKYTPLVRNTVNPTFYYVTLNDISVGGQALNLPASTFAVKSSGAGGVILDSGTTITQLIQAAYTPFVAKLRSLIKYPVADSSQIGLDLCYDTSKVATPSFPTIVLKFAGVNVSLPADNSFVLVDDSGTVCLAFAGTGSFTIIGNIQQQNFYYSYDRQNQRVGIAPAQCDSLTLGSGVKSSY